MKSGSGFWNGSNNFFYLFLLFLSHFFLQFLLLSKDNKGNIRYHLQYVQEVLTHLFGFWIESYIQSNSCELKFFCCYTANTKPKLKKCFLIQYISGSFSDLDQHFMDIQFHYVTKLVCSSNCRQSVCFANINFFYFFLLSPDDNF